MEDPIQLNNAARDYLTIDEAVRTLWEWRRYRNQVFWSSVYRWGAVAITMTIVPFLLPHLIDRLGNGIFVFPFMAFFLSMLAAYFTAVQYKLYKQVDRKYRSLLGKYNPGDIKERLFQFSIGKVVALLFLFFGIVIQILYGMVLSSLVNGVLP